MATGPVTAQASDRVAFLVGAGRSGTTLLYKLLCLHPQVAYISNYESRIGGVADGLAGRAVAWRLDDKLRAWFGHGPAAGSPTMPSRLGKLFPTPYEGEPVFRSAGILLCPAPDALPSAATAANLRWRLDRIRRRAGASIFLSNRTANNRRIPQLAAIFPKARYVHLVRDGRDVTRSLSLVSWWNGHTVWWDGRTPNELEQAGEPRLGICARNWVRELQEVRARLAAIDPQRVYELRFEELLADPLRQLERLLRFLDIDLLACYRAAIRSLNLRPVPAKWDTDWDSRQLACVLAETQPMLRALGYTE